MLGVWGFGVYIGYYDFRAQDGALGLNIYIEREREKGFKLPQCLKYICFDNRIQPIMLGFGSRG